MTAPATVTLVVMLLANGPRQQTVENYPDMWSCLDAAKRWSDSIPEHRPEHKRFKCEPRRK